MARRRFQTGWLSKLGNAEGCGLALLTDPFPLLRLTFQRARV
jgi:hypothetical protein